MTVLDASAVLAMLFGEEGGDTARRALSGAVLSAANLAEVIGKVVDKGADPRSVRPALVANGVMIEPVLAADAEFAGALRSLPGGRALSLGDRLCLALAVRSEPAQVLTADRVWASLPLPIEVTVIR